MKLIDIVSGTPLPLAYRIAFITNFYREPLLRRMERDFGLLRPEWTILICLAYRDGLNPRDICEITEQPRNTISRGVAALVRKGLVVQATDPDDARRLILRLTGEGRATYDAIMPMFVEGEARIAAALSPDEQVMLEALLDKLCRNVEHWRN
jgi:DNA-binding MarR family transcriptional regulator